MDKDKIDKQFVRNEEIHSKIVKKLLDHDDKFEEILENNRKNHNETMERFDQVMGIINRLDQERYAGMSRMDRMQIEINTNKKEITKVKKVLKIS